MTRTERSLSAPPLRHGAMAVLGAVVAVVPAARGAFVADDYWNLAEARSLGWGWDLLGRSVFGHVTPGTGAASWLVAGPGGGSYAVAVLQLAVLGALVPVVARAAARALGATEAAGTWAGVCTCLLVGWASASTWWSAGLNLYPSALGGMGLLLGTAAAVRGERWGAPVGALALAVALLFSEGAVVFVVLPAALVLQAADEAARSDDGVGRLAWLRARRTTWAILVTPLIVAAVVRASASEPVETYAHPSVGRTAAFAVVFVVRAFVPALFGLATGRFEVVGSALATTVASLALGGLVVLLVLRRRMRHGAWWMALAVLVVVLARGAMVGWSRLELLGWSKAFELRYVADLTWMAPVLVAALLVHDPGTAPLETDAPRTLRRRPSLLEVAAVVVVVAGLVGHVAVAQQAPARGVRSYRARVAASVRALPSDAVVIDGTVPAEVIGPEFGTFTFLSSTLDPTGVHLPFGTGAPRYVVHPDGTVEPIRLGPVSQLLIDQAFTATGAPGVVRDHDCWVAGGAGALVWVPLSVEVLRFAWVLDLRGTDGSSPDVGIVAAGRAPVASVGPSPEGRGGGRWIVATTGFTGSQVGFQLGAGERFCLAAGTIAQAVPAR